MPEQEPNTTEDAHSPRGALIGLAIVMVLVFGGLCLFYKLRDMSRREDCMMQGRTNCVPIDSTTPDK